MTGLRFIIRALLLPFAIVIGGWFVGNGFARGRTADRFVTVKGIAEREANADLALWPLRLVVADNDLGRAHQRIENSIRLIRSFLARNGIDTTTVELQDFRVTDVFANEYRQAGEVGSRYIIRQTLMVRSEHPQTVLTASQQVGDLVEAGVVLSSGEEYGRGGPTFLFNGLNDLKPTMIAEATARGREAAEQFARDSHSRIGGIRHASQGVFEILPRDQAPGIQQESQVVKKIRVVSTIEYVLRD
jgi:hypothetical protein